MEPVLNIIHLSPEQFPAGSPLRTEAISREHHIKAQAFEHKFLFDGRTHWSTTTGVWTGIIDKELPWRGISKSHKQIVQWAKECKLPFVAIAEDDFRLRPGGWKCFTENMPGDFDMYMAGISGGTVNEQTHEVTGWSGLFLYCIHSRFYDCFLSAPEDKNIDRWLSGLGLDSIEKQLGRKPVYKVCWPMACITRDGVSFKSGEYVDHQKYWKAYQVL